MKRNRRSDSFVLAVLGLFILLTATKASAIPAFARLYGTSCATCHNPFPKLNDFGRAFKDNGFKFPVSDEEVLKVKALLLGAPAQKEQFPNSIWPGTIPGMPPIGLRMNMFFQTVGKNRNNFRFVPTGTVPSVPSFVPRTDFESGLFSIFTAGNFGSDIAFWLDDDISVGGANANGGLGDAYLKFVNIGRLIKLPKDSLGLRIGQFELDIPFSQARSYNISPYDIYTESNVGAMATALPQSQQFVNNVFGLADASQGFELSGGHSYGGYHYSIAVVNQNSSGHAAGSDFVPSATGGNNGGLGFLSDSNFKDVYGRFSYRFNLERDKASRTGIQAAGTLGPRTHTFINLGTYYFYGRSMQQLIGQEASGTPTLITANEPFYRAGADFNFNYRKFNIYGLYMRGHDRNLLPIDNTGVVIPLPPSGAPPLPVGFIHARDAEFDGGFIQADYMVFPWMLTLMRYDAVNSSADRINGLTLNTGTPFFGPFSDTRNRFTPGVQFLIHANIKTSFEYQIRPKQQILNGVDPLTGTLHNVSPFRTNTFTAGLEWVY